MTDADDRRDHDQAQRTEHADPARSFLFLLGSARVDGNTEALAREAAAQLPSHTVQQWLRLSELPLPAFEDRRHTESGSRTEPTGNERLLLDATLEATDLVVVSPLYWYSVTAATKLYMDHWGAWLHTPEVRFKQRMQGKTLWAITTTSHDDSALADPLVGMLRSTADYLGMRWGGSLIGHGNRPGDVLRSDTAALTDAKSLFG
ncbi:NAD(P)H-dependent oxidoreductase [Streptomyces sp. SCA3-4]|uniref:flavodoxin family protein n=1 Tax=Streptomyces sichuanensis TaxID=2871810 RepID=UPI001CE2B3B8|nr:NAD(P)H-dependent oxidoreductase [Streptomyces sichuanensis]MCA6096077.1 NAD(P)H-dependent oxidoreductase [Streptomyces sichuanensis]